MFCIKCGSEIPEGGTFCIKCGTKAAATQETEAKNTQPKQLDMVSLQKSVSAATTQEQPAKPEAEKAGTQDIKVQGTAPTNAPKETTAQAAAQDALMEKIVQKNWAYYKNRFEALQRGDKDRINWAAFFLSILHASYRNVWRAWLKAVWMPLTLSLVSGFASMMLLFSNPKMMLVLGIVSFAANIWYLVAQIRYAKSFNRLYMNHVEQRIKAGDRKADPSILRIVLTCVCVMGISMAASIMISVVATQNILSALDDLDSNRLLEQSPAREQLPTEQIPAQPQTPDTAPTEPVAQASALLKDYTGSWMVDRYNNFIDGYVGFDLEERAGQLYLTVSAIWNQGDHLTTISDIPLDMNAEGTSGGAPYEDDRGNMGDVMLEIADGIPYLTVTIRGDGYYGIEMQHERCSRAEEQADAPLEITENAYENYMLYNEDDGHTYSYGIGSVEELAGYSLDRRYLWPSDQLEISDGALNDITQTEVAAIRNEIFARHGYIFSSSEWDTFFGTAEWYVPDPNYSESMLNETEKKNLAILTEYEKLQGWK